MSPRHLRRDPPPPGCLPHVLKHRDICTQRMPELVPKTERDSTEEDTVEVTKRNQV